MERDGEFYLLATCEIPEADLNDDPAGFLGVDLGIVNIATTSDGNVLMRPTTEPVSGAAGRSTSQAAEEGHPVGEAAAEEARPP